jgi:hypothetical protein
MFVLKNYSVSQLINIGFGEEASMVLGSVAVISHLSSNTIRESMASATTRWDA